MRWGLAVFVALLHDHPMTGVYCHGDRPTLADLFLVPQVYNARRFECDPSACPTIERIDIACTELAAFHAAAPGGQPEAAPPRQQVAQPVRVSSIMAANRSRLTAPGTIWSPMMKAGVPPTPSRSARR